MTLDKAIILLFSIDVVAKAASLDNQITVLANGCYSLRGAEMVIAAMRSHPAVAAAGLLGIVESCC